MVFEVLTETPVGSAPPVPFLVRLMSHRSDDQPRRPERPDSRPLLSVCTILILSGFVLGMAVSSQLSGELRTVIILAGLTGLLAFLGLDSAAFRRRQQLERQEQEFVEHRLVKHVDSCEITAADLPDHEELLDLARETTEAIDLDEILPANTKA